MNICAEAAVGEILARVVVESYRWHLVLFCGNGGGWDLQKSLNHLRTYIQHSLSTSNKIAYAVSKPSRLNKQLGTLLPRNGLIYLKIPFGCIFCYLFCFNLFKKCCSFELFKRILEKLYHSYHKNIKQLFFNFANNKMFLEQKICTLEWFQNDNLTVKTGVMTAENCCAKFFQISVCFFFFVLQLCRRPKCGWRWQEERRSQHFLSGLWTFIWALPEVGPPHVWTCPCHCHHQLLMYFYFPFFPL